MDLFVRVSNEVAVEMYKQLGYSVYRRVIGYYSDDEDAFGTISILYVIFFDLYSLDMRKALPRDTEKKSIIPLSHPVYPKDL